MTTAMLEADWLDAEQLARWLRDHGLTHLDVQLGNLGRRVREWERKGGMVSVYTADRVLVRLGHHLVDLPEEMWVKHTPQAKSFSEHTLEERIEAGRRYLDGENSGALAREYGTTAKSIRDWAAKL